MALALSFALEPPLEEALFVAPSLAISSFDMPLFVAPLPVVPLFVVLARDVLDFDIVALAEPAFDGLLVDEPESASIVCLLPTLIRRGFVSADLGRCKVRTPFSKSALACCESIVAGKETLRINEP